MRSCDNCLSILRFMDILTVMSFYTQKLINGHNVLHFLGLTPMSKVARSGDKCMF